MDLRRYLPFLAAAALTSTALIAAQEAGQSAVDSTYRAQEIRPYSHPMPFPPGSGSTRPVEPIQFRTPDQMTEADREVEADGEASIGERVHFVGLEFNEGKWSYQQIVCPAFPNHVLLKFTRNNGTGDVSMFTASIPRMGQGRVRIIPILRRGYSLFSPTPVNALTISAFNHIRAEEHPDGPPDWLGTGMCYAALAGAHPQVDLRTPDPDGATFQSGVAATLVAPVEGGAEIHFLDVAARPQPREWIMTFDKKGRLVKAARTPEPPIHPANLQPTLVDVRGTEIPPTANVQDLPHD